MNSFVVVGLYAFIEQLQAIKHHAIDAFDGTREAHASARSEAQRGQLGLGCNDVIDTVWGHRVDQRPQSGEIHFDDASASLRVFDGQAWLPADDKEAR